MVRVTLPGLRRHAMAGLDGIENKIDPGDTLDKDITSLAPKN